jgi:hypothetical protein
MLTYAGITGIAAQDPAVTSHIEIWSIAVERMLTYADVC